MIFDRIEYLCKLKNMTIYALETRVEVNHGTIQKWRNNTAVNPSSLILVKIADYFNVSVDYLLGRCTNPTSHIDIATVSNMSSLAFNVFKKLEDAVEEAHHEMEQIFKEASVIPEIDNIDKEH